MNPNDMAAAGGVIADFMDMAQKWQASNPGFPQNGPNPAMQLPLLVDLEESEEVYTLTADVPGLQKSDLTVACLLIPSQLSLFSLPLQSEFLWVSLAAHQNGG